MEEASNDKRYVIDLNPGESDLLRELESWRSSSGRSGVAAAVALLIDTEEPVYPVEEHQKDLAKTFGFSVPIEELSTREGRARTRQKCFASMSLETRDELVRLVSAYIGRLRTNISAGLGPITPETAFRIQELTGKEAKRLFQEHWWEDRDSDTRLKPPEEIIRRGLLYKNKVCPPRVLWEAIDTLWKDHTFNLNDLAEYGKRQEVARDFLCRQDPITLSNFWKLLARIRAEARSHLDLTTGYKIGEDLAEALYQNWPGVEDERDADRFIRFFCSLTIKSPGRKALPRFLIEEYGRESLKGFRRKV